MAKLTETAQWEDGIYQIETSDPVVGGPDGVTNRPARELANRTAYLKQQQEAADNALAEHVVSRNHPDGTLTEKGFIQLSNAVNSDSEVLAATPKAVKTVNDRFTEVNKKIDSMVTTLPAASLTQQGIVQLSSAVNSESEAVAATSKAVKLVNDLATQANNKTFSVADASLAQKGIVRLSSAINSDADTLAATPKAVKQVADELRQAMRGLSNSDSGALQKLMNGADIPDKAAFIRNLGIRNGTPGPAGPVGPQGPRGYTGATGAAGIRGPKGDGTVNRGSIVTNGWYQDSSNGFLIQWGTHTVIKDRFMNTKTEEARGISVNFPVGFASQCFMVVGGTFISGPVTWNWQLDQGILIGNISRFSFEYNKQYFSNTINPALNWGVSWIAIGR